MVRLITKQIYKLFKKCPKLAFLSFHVGSDFDGKDRIVSEFFNLQGRLVGELARNLYLGRKAILIEGTDLTKVVESTKAASKDFDVLFEAGYNFANFFTRPDIIDFRYDEIVEVKSGTNVKEEYLYDLAFQIYVLRKSGVSIKKAKLALVNEDYVFAGSLELEKFFKTFDLTELLLPILEDIESDLNVLTKLFTEFQDPIVKIEKKCFSPNKCGFIKSCIGEIPDDSIFNLRRDIKGRRFSLFSDGMKTLGEIPSYVTLTKYQELQRLSNCINAPIISDNSISAELSKIVFPIYFLDFETISYAIPRYLNTHPYQQVPFQVSIHKIGGWSQKPTHSSFLANSKEDPRNDLVTFLKENLGVKGTIVVYHSSFEINRLQELIKVSPKDEDILLGYIDRIWDLEKVFESGMYIHPSFKGSVSLKNVYPVLCNGCGYDDLEIDNGIVASIKFNQMIETSDLVLKKNIQRDLEAYCHRDTLATLEILKKLKELV